MKTLFGGILVILGLLLLLAYSPLPAGVIKNGFLAGLVTLFVSWRLLRAA